MSLQARLRHSLGERWMELPPRGVDLPLVVGRAAGCDIQVPSVTVGQRHCVLFVHEGHWIVQDVPGSSGTYVNGVKIEEAAFLNVGDAIRLGPDGAAPVLEIDPAAALAGQKGQPAAAVLPQAAAAARTAAPEPQPPPAPAAPAAYGYPQTYPPTQYPAEPAAGGWPSEVTPQYYTPPRRRRADGSNGVIIGMLLTLFIAAGTGYWLYRTQENSARVVIRPAPPTTHDDVPSTAPSPAPRPPAQTRPRVTPRITAPPIAATAPADTDPSMPMAPGDSDPVPTAETDPAPTPPSPQDPRAATAPVPGDDAGWKTVLAARQLKDEGKAILLFDDYAATHPGAPADKLREFTDEMLDRAWFERIAGLCDRREDLQKKIAELDKEIAEETDANYKTKVATPLREKYVAQLDGVEGELTSTMKYTGKTAPNLLDDEELEKLRKTRDPQLYARWKEQIVAHVRRTHGELPWVTNKSM
jgi:hypothetical protein